MAIPLISLGLPYAELLMVGLLLDNKLNTDDSLKLQVVRRLPMSQPLNILLVAICNIFQTSKDNPAAPQCWESFGGKRRIRFNVFTAK